MKPINIKKELMWLNIFSDDNEDSTKNHYEYWAHRYKILLNDGRTVYTELHNCSAKSSYCQVCASFTPTKPIKFYNENINVCERCRTIDVGIITKPKSST